MIKEYKLYYKHKNSPFILYDRTRISSWAESQFEQMKLEFPGAEYRIDPPLPKKKNVRE